jgi:hypothetical protein
MPDEKAGSAVAFLNAAVAYYKSLGVSVARVMTDNGSCSKSFAFARACRGLKIKHIRTKPYTPKTNGKAERFIQTALREWAKLTKGSSRRSPLEWSAEGYARAYRTSDQRAAELPIWTHHYNCHRPHGNLKPKPPNQPPRPLQEQPVEAPQLERSRDQLVVDFAHAAHHRLSREHLCDSFPSSLAETSSHGLVGEHGSDRGRQCRHVRRRHQHTR